MENDMGKTFLDPSIYGRLQRMISTTYKIGHKLNEIDSDLAGRDAALNKEEERKSPTNVIHLAEHLEACLSDLLTQVNNIKSEIKYDSLATNGRLDSSLANRGLQQ
jgi:hypothetical protein